MKIKRNYFHKQLQKLKILQSAKHISQTMKIIAMILLHQYPLFQ